MEFKKFFNFGSKEEKSPGFIAEGHDTSTGHSAEEMELVDISRQIATLSKNIEMAKNNPNHPHAGDLAHMERTLENLKESQARLGK